ncbi:MAG: dihydrolipoyl dehydrogenase family protein [Candidatus Omnitrophota bacterium]
MQYDLLIIGAGPGGYVAAIRAGQLGLKTGLIESSDVGGMCLNWGCIPTKALLESAKRLHAVKAAAELGIDGIEPDKLSFNWRAAVDRSERIVKRLTKGIEFLFRRNGVTVIHGTAAINTDKTVSVDNVRYSAPHIIIATGSRPMAIKDGQLPVSPDRIIESRDLLTMEALPERVTIWGSGPHAVELAQFLALVGKHTALVTSEPTLIPRTGPFLSDYALKILKKAGVSVRLSGEFNGLEAGEVLINASGRTAIVPESAVPLETKDGFIKVNDAMETSVPNIYAVGDVNGRCMFAHSASAQGTYAVNRIKGLNPDALFEARKCPINIYTYPEIAQVGMTEPELDALGIAYKLGEFPLAANGKALIEGEAEGVVRVLAEKKYGQVLGVQIVALHATDMMAEASLLMQMEGTVFDVASTVHAHPTLSEVLLEAGLNAAYSIDEAHKL